MKTFVIGWENCFGQSDTTKIKAKTSADAEKIFANDFGNDYIILFVKG